MTLSWAMLYTCTILMKFWELSTKVSFGDSRDAWGDRRSASLRVYKHSQIVLH